MELGSIQKQWLADLRAYPERKGRGALGTCNNKGEYRLCCLGQLLVTAKTMEDPNYKLEGRLYDTIVTDDKVKECSASLEFTFGDYGLRSDVGHFDGIIPVDTEWEYDINFNERQGNSSLAVFNDKSSLTWPQIADIIEANSDKLFTKSV